MTDTTPTPKEKGLIKHLSNRNYENTRLGERLHKATTTASSMLYDIDPKLVLKYKCDIGDTAQAYFKTEIREYENKSGKKHLAHFKTGGYWRSAYHGTVKKLGDEPVWYLSWTTITEKNIYMWEVKERGVLEPLRY